jgi:Flp pilus assembly protein TadB
VWIAYHNRFIGLLKRTEILLSSLKDRRAVQVGELAARNYDWLDDEVGFSWLSAFLQLPLLLFVVVCSLFRMKEYSRVLVTLLGALLALLVINMHDAARMKRYLEDYWAVCFCML